MQDLYHQPLDLGRAPNAPHGSFGKEDPRHRTKEGGSKTPNKHWDLLSHLSVGERVVPGCANYENEF